MPFNGLSFVHIKLDDALNTTATSLAIVPMFCIHTVLYGPYCLYTALRSLVALWYHIKLVLELT